MCMRACVSRYSIEQGNCLRSRYICYRLPNAFRLEMPLRVTPMDERMYILFDLFVSNGGASVAFAFSVRAHVFRYEYSGFIQE